MKKSNVAFIFMMIFAFLLAFEFYLVYSDYSKGDNLAMLDAIIMVGTAILWLISSIIMGKWSKKENIQKYKEKMLKEERKE